MSRLRARNRIFTCILVRMRISKHITSYRLLQSMSICMNAYSAALGSHTTPPPQHPGVEHVLSPGHTSNLALGHPIASGVYCTYLNNQALFYCEIFPSFAGSSRTCPVFPRCSAWGCAPPVTNCKTCCDGICGLHLG